MSLSIKARSLDDDWRVEVTNEVWAFKDTETMKKVLSELINYKNMYGRVDKRKFDR